MQVQINKPVTLGSVTYGKGQHTIPIEATKGWFFDALVQEESIVILRQDEDLEQLANKTQISPKATRKNKKSTEVLIQEPDTSKGE